MIQFLKLQFEFELSSNQYYLVGTDPTLLRHVFIRITYCYLWLFVKDPQMLEFLPSQL